ncbi:DUF192 domain-containing protein [Granulicella sibirica]|uniref:DUF192 domain-containing protein n=1 Tax=Granulicella sibirica TaxID=2479048 RepID=A0A4Q0STN6_9BACT|nr:DUF192 domain-containing protein [Granulicella sibirica]RXH54345.1 hypothetical protein GRAN_4641 [Granulicella sibirica]
MDTLQRNGILVINATNGAIVCSSGHIANTFVLRLKGLLGKRGMQDDAGLLITPSSGVHTFGMLFPIDIISLDKNNRVLGAWERTGPWKMRGLTLRTRSVLELPAGKIRRSGIIVGDRLIIEVRR